MKRENVISKLKEIAGESNVLLDDESKRNYGKDLTQQFDPQPLVIVFPKTEDQIISIVELANESRTGLVPSGGRTGYSGGAVSNNNEIVVSFEKFNRIIDINLQDKQIKCEAGVTTAKIQALAKENGLFYPVDFASAGSSQIGGNVATNAGGIKVIRYGLTRQWVAGLKVVTGGGKVLNLNKGLIKNACGYDLRHLFVGSEGTLGLVTEVTLQLLKSPPQTKVWLFSVGSKNNLIDILNQFDSSLEITAFEFFSDAALAYVISETGQPFPFARRAPFYILLEYESDERSDEAALLISEKCMENQWVCDALLSANEKQAESFWRYREAVSISLLRYTPFKYDISIMPSKIAAFMDEADRLLECLYPAFEIIWFGHVGDGNLHLNILKPAELSSEAFFAHCHEHTDRLFELIEQYEGSVSAEHGIGLLKKEALHYSRSSDEIDYMREIKRVFDPNGIMNPGKLLDFHRN